jgi:hypothetical protein
MIGHFGQASQHVLKVSVGIDTPAAAAFDDGVNDGSAISGIRIAHEEPVLFSQSRRADGIFHQVVVDLHAIVLQVDLKRAPLTQRVINGDAQQALRQGSATALESDQSAFKPLNNGFAFVGANRCA